MFGRRLFACRLLPLLPLLGNVQSASGAISSLAAEGTGRGRGGRPAGADEPLHARRRTGGSIPGGEKQETVPSINSVLSHGAGLAALLRRPRRSCRCSRRADLLLEGPVVGNKLPSATADKLQLK